MISPAEIDRAAAAVDPVAFQRAFLGRRIWKVQQDIARSLETHSQTAVKGCHASGKTYVAAGAVLQWLIAHQHGKVFTTAPTLRQVKTFWREIRTAWESGFARQYLPEPSTTALEVSADRYAVGASSSVGVNVQGLHGENVLIVADEAPGIGSDIWDAIQGIRAGGRVSVLEMGNPVVPSGQFFDCFGRERMNYNCISISAFDTPNLQHPDGNPITFAELLSMDDAALDYAPFPPLISRRWVKERYLTWGPAHPKFLSRVMAQFPSQSPYSVFDLAWIERAKRDATDKELSDARNYTIQVGVDVAGAGSDETTLCARVRGILLEQRSWHDADPRGAVCVALSQLMHHPLYRMGCVVVDIVGIGYNFALHLADQGFPVLGFQAGSRPVNGSLYVNQKAEAYFTAREYFKNNLVSGLNDEECEAQLSTVQYHETSRGLTEIESKEDAQKRGIPSPDRAEALVMAFCRVIPRSVGMSVHEDVVISPY